MSRNDRPRASNQKGSVPPELRDADLRWDDDGAPNSLELDLGEDDNAFDRVTAIPEIPNEVLARRLMERADAAARRDRGSQVPTSPPMPDGAHTLYEADDHEEQTVKIDAEGLQRRVARMSSDPGPILTFEFTADSDLPPAEEHLSERRLDRAADDTDLPPALGAASGRGRQPPPRLTPATNTPRFQREPSVPRTRLPTAELVLELDTLPGPPSALELADSAPVVDRPSDPSLEFDMPAAPNPWEQQGPASEQADMKDRYAMGDFTGALVIAEGILESDPSDVEAKHCAEKCREVLTQMYSARLGPLTQTVSVAIPNDEIRWLSLDHRAGFLLSLVDGSLTLDEILDVSGMPKLEALRLMFTLFDQHVIRLK